MAGDSSSRWNDRAFLRTVQYADDSNLAARQSIYAFRHPRLELAAAVLDAAQAGGSEVVADVGCGNGGYLAELARRGHAGPVLGIDLSPGMLAAARTRAAGLASACLLTGDAAQLPVRTGSADLTLAMHMLYHVHEPDQAAAELRRVTRPGGTVVVGLNADDHLRELWDLIRGALADAGLQGLAPPGDAIRLTQGEELLAPHFGSVVRHDFAGELRIPGFEPVGAYLRSMNISEDPEVMNRAVDAVASRFQPGADGYFRVTSHAGCLVCT